MAHYGPNEAPPMPVRLYHMCAPASCDTTGEAYSTTLKQRQFGVHI